MSARIRVFPGSVVISHPSGGPVRSRGSLWPNDGFTHRRIQDGSVLLEEAKKADGAVEGGVPGVGARRDVGETRQEVVDRKIAEPLKK